MRLEAGMGQIRVGLFMRVMVTVTFKFLFRNNYKLIEKLLRIRIMQRNPYTHIYLLLIFYTFASSFFF